MVKCIFLGLMAFLLFSCSSTSSNEPADGPISTEIAQDLAPAQSAESRLQEGIPSLHNGQKWKADANTNKNVGQLKQILTDFQMEDSHAESDYRRFQKDFSAGLQNMVRECKMTGADHDALHVWLEPLMQDNRRLAEVRERASMEGIVQTMSDRLSIYSQYFE